ncbi:MAG: thermonuclease family protein [Pirellulales bacterium]|nr:thermonuclease family protein [Pirellulales bacterium]
MVRRTGRRYHRPLRSRSPLGLVALLLLIALLAWRLQQEQDRPPVPASLAEGAYQIERVIDGDTLLLTNGARIRLIGADTPETVKRNCPIEPWGPEAAEFTKQFVSGGRVRLQLDREQRDIYDRFLAYVWVGNRMLNEELIRAGLARARTSFYYSTAMKTRFRRAEDEARGAGRAIWSDPEGTAR